MSQPRAWLAIAIVGPTAVGKSEVGLSLAEALGAEIVSVDSRQVYRRLDIGTSKPTANHRQAVAHHLLDVLDPGETYSAGRFAAEARRQIDGIARGGRPVLLVGGSGLYLTALVDGLFVEPEGGSDLRQVLTRRADEEGLAALHAELAKTDPAGARALSPTDGVRILRALELAAADGQRRGQRWTAAPQPGLDPAPLMVGLTRAREELCRRIDARAEGMLRTGWPAEVESLLAAGYPETCPGLQSLGYAQVVALVRGRLTEPEALDQIRRRTRQYAKRQMTWFRRDRRLRWLDLDALGAAGARDRIQRQWEAWTRPRVPQTAVLAPVVDSGS